MMKLIHSFWRRSRALLMTALATLAVSATGAAPSSTWRVLILSGEGGFDRHGSTALLRELLIDTGRFDVRVSESPVGLTAEALSAFDVVNDHTGSSLGPATEKALTAFVEAGHGLVVTRRGFGSITEKSSRGLGKLIHASPPPDIATASPPPLRMLEVKLLHPEHPIVNGLKNPWRTADRSSAGFSIAPAAEVLAANGQGEPVLFVSRQGSGRVFGTTLGSDVGAMQERAFITTFLRGVEWAASGRVTLPAELRMPEPATNGLRVLVITGGHDHEAAFYGLFDGYKDIGWAPVLDSTLAFKQDLRAKYDVIVFYDFTRDMDDKAKQNLRDFVESNKGVVVLHHGILNFQKWPWWYEEVVGGLYRLERQGTIPNSTVKFGEDHWITAAGPHPITDGFTPFHVTDETYHGLFISTNVQPLLLTDNATSDHTVAWIGPCKTSKVVFVQLGHDHSPFRHPSYRALVHNAILWTGGRLQ